MTLILHQPVVLIQRAATDDPLVHHTLYNGSNNQTFWLPERLTATKHGSWISRRLVQKHGCSLRLSLCAQVQAAALPNQDTVERSVLESLVPDWSYPIKTPLMFSNNTNQEVLHNENMRETMSHWRLQKDYSLVENSAWSNVFFFSPKWGNKGL